jgi:itaconyl-CoA hydratase
LRFARRFLLPELRRNPDWPQPESRLMSVAIHIWREVKNMPVKAGWSGRFFEDFEVGDIYRTRTGRTITQVDNIWFSLLTNNSNQIHFNQHYAALTEFKRPLVNSALTIAIVGGLSVSDTSENGINLGWDAIRLPNPVFEGDTVYSESEVLEKRESRSRPQQGIIKIRTRGIKHDGTVVLDYTRSILVWKRSYAPVLSVFPEPKAAGGS